MYNNVKFALVCSSYISKPPLKVYNGSLSNLKYVIEQLSAVGLVAFVNEGCLPLFTLDLTLSVVYYGEKQVIEKFRREKNQVDGVFEDVTKPIESPPLAGEVGKDVGITAGKTSTVQVEEKIDKELLSDRFEKSDKENINPKQ